MILIFGGVSVTFRTGLRSSKMPGLSPGLCRRLIHLGGRNRGSETPTEAHMSPPDKELLPEKTRERKAPNKCSVLLFPGQGSQFVGMGSGLLRYGAVKDMFSAAQNILGYDLLSLCLHGPQEELMKTQYCQPAVFVTSLAAVEKLNQENPQVSLSAFHSVSPQIIQFRRQMGTEGAAVLQDHHDSYGGTCCSYLPTSNPILSSCTHCEAIETCVAAAGFSVGEFAALVFSGAMDFAEALYAVKVRAEAMQKASELIPSGMLSVVGRPQAKYNYACLQAREHCLSLGIQDPVCSVANYLFPDGRVIAGHQEALDFLQKNSRQLHFLRAQPLPVSGAFHTQLMESASEPLREVLQQLEVRRPEVSVYSNVDGKRYMHAGHVRRQLVKQLASPVKWEQTLHEVYERSQGQSFPHTYEVGPGKQLGATLQRCNMKAYKSYTHVDVTAPED